MAMRFSLQKRIGASVGAVLFSGIAPVAADVLVGSDAVLRGAIIVGQLGVAAIAGALLLHSVHTELVELRARAAEGAVDGAGKRAKLAAGQHAVDPEPRLRHR